MLVQHRSTVILPTIESRARWVSELMRDESKTYEQRLVELNNTDLVVDQAKYDADLEAIRMATNFNEVHLTHPNRHTNDDWGNGVLLNGTTTVRQFIDKMKVAANNYVSVFTNASENDKKQIYNQYVGGAFELFVEALIKLHGTDRRIGIYDYKTVDVSNGDEDLGVDGIGIGTNGKPATVQVKFRSDMNSLLTANKDGLSNFKNSSHELYGVDFNDTENMLIVTTAKGLHHFTCDKMLNGKVRCLALDGIEKLVDNNINFWNDLRRLTQPLILTNLIKNKKELVV